MDSLRNLAVLAAALAAGLGGFVSVVRAHTVWIEPAARAGEYRVMLGGHEGKSQSYSPEKLKSVAAIDAQGGALKVVRRPTADGVVLRVAQTPVLIAVHFDNGIYTRGASGPSVEKPMNEVPGAVRATHAVKYHKTVISWLPRATTPVGQAFEVVPLEETPPRAGQPMKVQVLQDGRPVPGVKLGRGEEGGVGDPVTDVEGIAVFVPETGFNKLWAGRRVAVSGDPRYTEVSYEYLLGFEAR